MGQCCSKDTHLYVLNEADQKDQTKIEGNVSMPLNKNEKSRYKSDLPNEEPTVLKTKNIKLKLDEDKDTHETNIISEDESKNKQSIILKLMMLIRDKFNLNSEDTQFSNTPKNSSIFKDKIANEEQDLDFNEKQKMFARKIYKYNSNPNRKKVVAYLNNVKSEQNLNVDLDELKYEQLEKLLNSFNEDIVFLDLLNKGIIEVLPRKNEKKLLEEINNTSLGTDTFKELRIKIVSENYLVIKNYVKSCKNNKTSNIRHLPINFYNKNKEQLDSIVDTENNNDSEEKRCENLFTQESDLKRNFINFFKIEKFLCYLQSKQILVNGFTSELEKNEQKYIKGYEYTPSNQNSNSKVKSFVFFNIKSDFEDMYSDLDNKQIDEIVEIINSNCFLNEFSSKIDEILKKLNNDFIYDLKFVYCQNNDQNKKLGQSNSARKTFQPMSKNYSFQKINTSKIEFYEKLLVTNLELLDIKRMDYYRNLNKQNSKDEDNEDDMDKFGTIF